MADTVETLIKQHIHDPELRQLLLDNPDLMLLFSEIDERIDDSERQVRRLQDRLTNIQKDYEAKSDVQNEQFKSLSYRAYHDSMTGLPNRNYLLERTDAAILQAHRSSTPFALLFLDLDGFKYVNDHYGHDRGDKILKLIGERLKSVIRETDMIARLAGDEFCILLMNLVSPSQSARVAKMIFDLFDKPLEMNGQDFSIGMSIGISHFPEDGSTTKQLMKNADIAMYAAKKRGPNHFQFYDKSLTEKVSQRLEFELDLSRAIENDELSLTVQPHMRMSDGKVIALSTDILWQHPERGETNSEQFYSSTTNSQLLMPLLDWQISQCAKLINDWKEQGLPCPLLRVYVDPRQFSNKELFKHLSLGLEKFPSAASNIELIICETSLNQNTHTARRIIVQCRKQGFMTGISFLGEGFLPTALLQSCQLNSVQFEDPMTAERTYTEESKIQLLKGMLSMTYAINAQFHVRGVNTKADKVFFAQQECEILSGNYFSPAVTPEEFTAVLSRFKPQPEVKSDEVIDDSANDLKAG